MRSLFKASAYLVLLLLMGAGLVLAVSPALMVVADEVKTDKDVTVTFSAGWLGMDILGSEVHQQAYLTYLVKEYAPDTMDDWSTAFAERKKASVDLAGKGAFFGFAAPASVDGGAMSFKIDSMCSGEGVTAVSPDKKDIVIKIADVPGVKTYEFKDGKIINPDKDLTFADKDSIFKPIPQEQLEAIKARAEMYKSFERAVDSQDVSKLKELLPKVLEDYKLTTQNMVKATEEMKKTQ